MHRGAKGTQDANMLPTKVCRRKTKRSMFLRVTVRHNRTKLENCAHSYSIGYAQFYHLLSMPSFTTNELRKLHVEIDTNSSIMPLSSPDDPLSLPVSQDW